MSALPTGLYQPGQSPIHRLCPWVKILCLLILLAAVVTTDTLWVSRLKTVVLPAPLGPMRPAISVRPMAISKLLTAVRPPKSIPR